MNRTELREKLNKIDCENFNQYDLVNLFESVKLSNEDLNKLSKIVNNEKAVYNFLNEKAYPSAVFSKSDIVKSPKKLTESKKATKRKASINEGFNGLGKDAIERIKELESGGEVSLTIAKGDDGEDFLIVDSYDDVQKLQKAIDPNFKPEDKYDTSLLYDAWSGDWGFQDEYSVCDLCGKVIRTSPDSYSWTPDYFADYESGEMVCGDCVRENPANYLNYLINNPKNANTILDKQGLEAEGFELIEEDYENGWYDRSDNPKEILEKALEEYPEAEFVFFYDDEYDDFELASIYGGDFTYCPVCGATMEYDEDGDHYCPKCKKSGHTLSLIRRGFIKDDSISKNEKLGEGFSKDDIEWLKSHKGEKLNKGKYKVEYQEYFDNDNNPIGGMFTLYKRAGKHGYDRYAFKNEDELIAYIKRHFFDESLSESVSIPRNAKKIKVKDLGATSVLEKTEGGDWRVIESEKDELVGKLIGTNFLRTFDSIEVLETDPNYTPKRTKEVKVLQGYYDLGWEDLITYSAPYDYKEIRDDLKSYRDNEKRMFRVITRRVPIEKDESLYEDTIKQNGKWVNKGKEGTHGKFKTKKAADAQRKAMFAKGFSVNESVDPNTLPDDYVLLDSRARNHTDKDIDLYYDCIKEFCMVDEIAYDDMEVTFITNQRDADDWDEETFKTDYTYTPDEESALECANDYLVKKYTDKITVGDIKKSADDVYNEVKDFFYEKAQKEAEETLNLSDFQEQLKEDKAKETMKSVVAKWRSRRSNKE